MTVTALQRRLAAPAVTLALAAGTVVGVQAPARAADVGTSTVLQVSHKKALYGTRLTVQAATVREGTEQLIPASAGTLSVQMKKPGGAWKTIATPTAGKVSSTRVKAPMNVQFRAVYAGGSTDDDQFAGSTSAVSTVKVARKLTLRDVGQRTALMKGTISPRATLKVTIKRKVGKRWKKWKTLRARKGVFKVTLSGRNGQKFRIYLPREKKFISNWYLVTLRIYRGQVVARTAPLR